MNQAIHSVDLLTWLMGPVAEITAHTATAGPRADRRRRHGRGHAAFANGALGVIEASTAAYPGYLKRIEIHGSEGSASMEEEDIVAWDFAKKTTRRRGDSRSDGRADEHGRRGERPERRSAITATPSSFATCSRRSARTASRPVDGHEGRRSVEIILGIYKAAETGKAVKLPLASDPVLAARKRKAK